VLASIILIQKACWTSNLIEQVALIIENLCIGQTLLWMMSFLHGRFYIAISALLGIILQPPGASLVYDYS
jgi:hypothetical protein